MPKAKKAASSKRKAEAVDEEAGEVKGGAVGKKAKKEPAKAKAAEVEESKASGTKGSGGTNGSSEASSAKAAAGMQRCARPANWKITTWNVNGARAWVKKEGLRILKEEAPDVLTLQETKCAEKDLPPELANFPGYHCSWVDSQKKGYAGVGLMSKTKPLSVTLGLGQAKHDSEGRLITAEFPDFFLVSAYVPNSGQGLKRLAYRTKEWNPDLLAHLKALDARKPVVYTGDLNVAHKEIDIKNPKGNVKNAGFTPEERAGMDELLEEGGLVDSFRALYPEKEGAFTYWSFMSNARAKGIGWRLDYFLLSRRLLPNLVDNRILDQHFGSDHCPVELTLALP